LSGESCDSRWQAEGVPMPPPIRLTLPKLTQMRTSSPDSSFHPASATSVARDRTGTKPDAGRCDQMTAGHDPE
jgi:hypothetical protein